MIVRLSDEEKQRLGSMSLENRDSADTQGSEGPPSAAAAWFDWSSDHDVVPDAQSGESEENDPRRDDPGAEGNDSEAPPAAGSSPTPKNDELVAQTWGTLPVRRVAMQDGDPDPRDPREDSADEGVSSPSGENPEEERLSLGVSEQESVETTQDAEPKSRAPASQDFDREGNVPLDVNEQGSREARDHNQGASSAQDSDSIETVPAEVFEAGPSGTAPQESEEETLEEHEINPDEESEELEDKPKPDEEPQEEPEEAFPAEQDDEIEDDSEEELIWPLSDYTAPVSNDKTDKKSGTVLRELKVGLKIPSRRENEEPGETSRGAVDSAGPDAEQPSPAGAANEGSEDDVGAQEVEE